MMKNPIKMDDLGVPLFLETPILLTGRYSSKAPFPGGMGMDDDEGRLVACHDFDDALWCVVRVLQVSVNSIIQL